MDFEFVNVPKELIGYVIGTGGSVIKAIEQKSGAKVFSTPKETEGFKVSGDEEQRACARRLILERVARGKIKRMECKFNKVCYYIDGWNLPADCKLKLDRVVQDNDMGFQRSQEQYRLKPAEGYEPQKLSPQVDDSSYLTKLKGDTLESLRQLKAEMTTLKKYLKADMWCHFGTLLIRRPRLDEDAKGEWTIEEAAKKFLENQWRGAFNGGVNLDEKNLEENIGHRAHKEYEDYSSRYDWAFKRPNSRQIRFKVWVAKKNLGKKLEDVPIPFSDVKNVLAEVHFEDELTRSRCRGWLVLPSRRYLQADILFPGCEFDCRLTIRERLDNALQTDFAPKEDTINALSRYLSKLTFEDDFGPRLPAGNVPDGFWLSYMRCSKRAVYVIKEGFTIILSKESSCQSNVKTNESRTSTDFHLHCSEWDELLNSGEWEPEVIVEKLPEFFRFVRKVQSIITREMKDTKTAPPEILARGHSALKAYRNALADGETLLRTFPLMLIGQDRAGKTSLKKSLKGIFFDPEEDSTVGIDVDPSLFKVTTETWRTGTKESDDNSDDAISFDYHAAKCVADSLNKEGKTTKVSMSSDGKKDILESTVTERSQALSTSIPIGNEEGIPTTEGQDSPFTSTSSDDVHIKSPDSRERKQKHVNRPILVVPDEVATVTETLLQTELEDNTEDIYSTLWDFAGQSVYYETHPLFLTERAMYCLVYDLSLNPDDQATPTVKQGVYKKYHESLKLKTNFDYLDFWMRSVVSSARCQSEDTDVVPTSEFLPDKLPPVFLVCTHADTPYVGSNSKELAYEVLGRLKSKPYHAHLVDVFFVDNTKSGSKSDCPEVMRLRQEVLDIAHELPQTNKVIPIKWLAFVKALQKYKENGDKYISLERAKNIAAHCGINEHLEIKTLMDYLHDLRILIHFDDSPELNEMVVLDPQWLIDVFKKVITVQPAYQCSERKFLKLWEKLEKNGILDEKLLVHMWEPLFENRATFDVLIAIMEKFTLLCAWPSDGESKSYLVPSMLKSQPPNKIRELVASAQFPSLFVKFENGHVPPGFFPRFVLQFFQWGKDTFLTPVKANAPQLFHDFARFFVTTFEGEVCSVAFNCHASTVEVAVLSEDHHGKAGFSCARDVCVQVEAILKDMRNGFHWLRNMKYEMSVLCPVCCPSGEIDCCPSHDGKTCHENECLHFWSLSELCKVKQPVICTRDVCTPKNRVHVDKFGPWISPGVHQELRPSTLPSTLQAAAAQTDARPPDKTLKVTLLASEWGSSMGGLSTINRKLAISLARHKQLNVTLVVPQSFCSEEDRRDAGRHNIFIREAPSLPGYTEPLDWLSVPPKDLDMDIVLGHGAKLGKQAQFIKRFKSCKWVQVVHTAPEELGMYKNYSGAIAKGEEKNRAEVDLCKLADLVVAVGPKLREVYSSYLRSCKKHDVKQLTPGIFLEFSTTEQAAKEGKFFKVLTFGRSDSEDLCLKGYDIAAKAVAELKDSSCYLVFVGASDGKQEEVAEHLVECGISRAQLIVRGFVPSEEILKELFCEVDLAIMPSRTEGFGLTALEALSAGLPILVSSNSGFGEALRDLPLGKSVVVESEDPKVWAEAIASVRAKGRAQRLQEMQTLRASYGKRYNWEDQCEALAEKMLRIVYEDSSN